MRIRPFTDTIFSLATRVIGVVDIAAFDLGAHDEPY
jgi:hypothetical protein